jgi:hypothetical protein
MIGLELLHGGSRARAEEPAVDLVGRYLVAIGLEPLMQTGGIVAEGAD